MNTSLATLIRREDVRKLFSVLGAEECRLVGGVVRDALQDRALKDIDVAARLSPEQMCRRLEAKGIRFAPTGICHGTITAWIEDTRFEITRLRRDEESDGRHARIAPTADWDEDANRRDFTINAIYADAEGRIYDPLGGVADLRARKVRFIGNPRERIQEDYLRIMRFFRFSASHGKPRPDAEGLWACAKMSHGLKRISGERIRDELERILLLERGREALGWMAEGGVLAQCIGRQIDQADLERYEALMKIETQCGLSTDSGLRFAALLDGKEAARAAVPRLRLSRVCGRRLVDGLDLILNAPPSDMEVKGLLYRKGKERAKDAVLLSWAKSEACGNSNGKLNSQRWRRTLNEVVSREIPSFPLTGEMVVALGIEEGLKVGRILAHVETCWIAEGFLGDESWAIKRARGAIEKLSAKARSTASDAS